MKTERIEKIEFTIDSKIDKAEQFLGDLNMVRVFVPFIPGAIKIGMGATQATAAFVCTIFFGIGSRAMKENQNCKLLADYSWMHVKHGLGNIVAGTLESIYFINIIVHLLKVSVPDGELGENIRSSQTPKSMPYPTLVKKTLQFTCTDYRLKEIAQQIYDQKISSEILPSLERIYQVAGEAFEEGKRKRKIEEDIRQEVEEIDKTFRNKFKMVLAEYFTKQFGTLPDEAEPNYNLEGFEFYDYIYERGVILDDARIAICQEHFPNEYKEFNAEREGAIQSLTERYNRELGNYAKDGYLTIIRPVRSDQTYARERQLVQKVLRRQEKKLQKLEEKAGPESVKAFREVHQHIRNAENQSFLN